MATQDPPVQHTVYRSINKSQLWFGVDRRLFAVAAIVFLILVLLAKNIVGGILAFAALYCFASWATKTDEKILQLIFKPLVSPSKYSALLDPGKIHRSNIILERHQ